MLTAIVSHCKIYLYTNKFVNPVVTESFHCVSYFRPTTLTDAVAWLAENDGRIAAGCTDLFPGTDRPALSGPVLDITAIDALRGIEETDEGWRFGAATTWTDVLRAGLPAAFDGLKLAAREVGSMQIQNAGTLGGNLCNASPAADGVPCLLTLDAEVELTSQAGCRTLPLGDFIKGPRQTALGKDELLSALHIPRRAGRGSSTFLKLGARKYLVISIAMVAARLVIEDDTIAHAALSVGACSAVAQRLPDIETALIGQPAGPDAAAMITDTMVGAPLAPIADVRSDAAYRSTAAAELVRRVVRSLLHDPKEAAA